jgi:hypothetical protein
VIRHTTIERVRAFTTGECGMLAGWNCRFALALGSNQTEDELATGAKRKCSTIRTMSLVSRRK